MDNKLTENIDQLNKQIFISVGFSVGIISGPNDTDPFNPNERLYWIRCGDKFHGIPWPAVDIWLRATVPASGAEIKKHLFENKSIESPDIWIKHLTELLEGKLIIPFEQNKLSSELLSLKIIALGVGLGVNLEDPREYLIAHIDGSPVAGLDFVAYILWMYFDGVRTLKQAIKDAAIFLQISEHTLTERVPSLLEVLLITRTAYLDIPTKENSINPKVSAKKFFQNTPPGWA
jgi:hypothetical protein